MTLQGMSERERGRRFLACQLGPSILADCAFFSPRPVNLINNTVMQAWAWCASDGDGLHWYPPRNTCIEKKIGLPLARILGWWRRHHVRSGAVIQGWC